MLSGFEIVSGLADGASVMPAKWNKPVFSFRFYAGRISRPPLPGAFHRGLRRKSHPAATANRTPLRRTPAHATEAHSASDNERELVEHYGRTDHALGLSRLTW
jgi:hypothetical protein